MLHVVRLCKRARPCLLRAHSTNYFEILNVPEDFNLNLNKLKKNYKELQETSHPDKNVRKSVEEQLSAAEQSVNINNAYKCLKDTFCRAKHLLAVKGKVFDEKTQINDLVFLSDIMDFNDELETCEDYEHLRKFKIQNEEGILIMFELFEQNLESGNLDEALECLLKLNFLRQNRVRLDEKVEEVRQWCTTNPHKCGLVCMETMQCLIAVQICGICLALTYLD